MKSKPDQEIPALDVSAPGLWQPLPNETSYAYSQFCSYLELGAEGTLQQVADDSKKSLSAVCRLSARYHWMERATAYRQHISHAFLVAANRERAKQTELCQMRDQIHRQQMWEDSQAVRAYCRKSLANLLNDPKATLAGYEMKGLFDLYFKLGCRANAPTGFISDGPVPASPDFEASLKKVYGSGLNLGDLLELLKLSNPGQEALIDEKLGPASNAAGTPPPPPLNGNGGVPTTSAPPGTPTPAASAAAPVAAANSGPPLAPSPSPSRPDEVPNHGNGGGGTNSLAPGHAAPPVPPGQAAPPAADSTSGPPPAQNSTPPTPDGVQSPAPNANPPPASRHGWPRMGPPRRKF
jgi:hypothetical protein